MVASHPSSPAMGNVRFESVAAPLGDHRLDSWDAARLIATFGIVWTHVCDAHGIDASMGTLGRFGTSYYILAAALFTVRGYQRSAVRQFSVEAGRRARRLMLPFLIWSSIYFIYYYGQSLQTGRSFRSLTMWWGPAAGTALHLWFLPFIYVWGLFGVWLVPKLMKTRTGLLLLLSPLVVGGIYWVCFQKIFFAVSRPWLWSWHLHRLDRWIVEVPLYVSAIWVGSAFYHLSSTSRERLTRHHRTIALLSIGLFVTTQIVYSEQIHFIRETTGTDGRPLSHLAGLALLFGSAALGKTRVVRFMAPWGRFTYVTFLVHVLVLDLMRAPLKSLPGYGTVTTALLSTGFVFLISLGLSWLIARFRIFAWLRP